jgi:hypothetical protein
MAYHGDIIFNDSLPLSVSIVDSTFCRSYTVTSSNT